MRGVALDARPRRSGVATLVVRPRVGGKSLARITAGAVTMPCVLGPGGLVRSKREGDGGTPVGRFALLGGFYRQDRCPRPPSRFPLRASRPEDGWCDDPASPRYNRPVRLPFAGGHERMWRQDRLYDCGLVVDYNIGHPRKGRGSAIFVHIMAPSGAPTAGCVALRPDDLRRLLPRLARRCRIVIG